MLTYLIKYAKRILTLLLIGFLLTAGSGYAQEEVRVRFIEPSTKIEQTLPAWAVRSCDVIVRVGEYEGKAGKRVYIDEGISWSKIPKDIAIHKDNEGHYISEFDINKKLAEKLVTELRAKGVNAQIQIANDRAEDLNAAARISNKSNPKLYVSIHHNSYNSDSYGYFAMCNENDATALAIAQRLSDSVKDNGEVKQMRTRYNDGYIGELNHIHNSTVGVLLEMGFYSNKEELSVICSDSYTDYTSQHLAEEIESILNDYWR